MADEPSFLRRVREWLGSVSSSPEEIERVVTEATVDWGGRELSTRSEQLAFVDGPLAGAVSRALSPTEALKALRTIGSAVAVHPNSDRATPLYAIDTRVTGRIPVPTTERVPILVVAQSDATANRLSVLLGEDRAHVVTAADKLTFVAGLAEHPLVVLIDATDAPPLGPDQVVAFTERSLPHAFWVVWGVEREFGLAIERRMRSHVQPHIFLNSTDGIGPILDVVLSRRAG